MVASVSVLSLVAVLTLALFLSLLSLSSWRVRREDRAPVWLAAWLGASAAFALCRILQYAPQSPQVYVVIPRILLTVAYSLAWLAYEHANASVGYRPPRRERAGFLLLVAVPVALLWTSQLILTDRIVTRTLLLGTEFQGVVAGVLYLPASLLILALGIIPVARLWRARSAHSPENRMMAAGYAFVVLFSLHDFVATAFNVVSVRLSDYSYLPMAIFFSYLQLQRFGRLYEEMNVIVRERTVRLSEANETLRAEIAERAQVEAALRASEYRFATAFRTSPDSINLNRLADGLYLEINDGFTALTGYSAEDVRGKTSLELDIWADPADRARLVVGLRERGEVANLEAGFRMKNGVVKTGLMSARIIQLGGETCILSITRDISELKSAQEEIRRRAEEMTALYETTHDLVIEHDVARLLATIVERAAGLVGATGGGLYLCEPEQRQVRCVVSYHTTRDYTGVVLRYGEGAAGLAAETGEPLIVDDYRVWAGRAAVYEADQPFVSLLSVPMHWQDRVIGVIHVLDNDRPHAFGPEDLRVVTLFARQAAIAIEQSRLLESERRRRMEAAALAEVGRDITTSLRLDVVLERIATHALDLLRAESSAVYLSDPARSTLQAIAATGPDAEALKQDPLQMGAGILGDIAIRRAGEIVNDTNADARATQVAGTERIPHEHLMAVPVLSKNQLTGLIAVWRIGAGQDFRSADLDFLSNLAAQVAVAIENARLFDEARRRADEFAILYETARELADAQNLPSLLQAIACRAAALFETPCAAIYLHDPLRHDLELALQVGVPLPAGTRLAWGEGMAGRVAQTRQPLMVEDYHTWPGRSPQYEAIPFSATLQVPMLYHGELVGVLDVSDIGPATRKFTEADARLLSLFGAQAASAVHDARLMDTLEQRVAERTRALADANVRLTALDRLKSKFVSDVSHELRTPVTNLNLYLNLLQRGKPEKRADYMTMLRQQAARLTQLIEDILDLSRLEASTAQVLFKTLDLNALAALVVAAQRPAAEAKGLALNLETPGADLPAVRGVATQLTQVITNLVANAIQYTQTGSVTVSTLAGPDRVLLQVRDTGIGIDAEDLPHLFERFYRGRATAQSTTPGTGLGLAIAKEIVDAHGGQIEVATREGDGSTFTVSLPGAPGGQPARA